MPVRFLDRVYPTKNIRTNLLDTEENMVEEVKNIIGDTKGRKVKVEKSDKGLLEHTADSIIIVNENNQQLLKD